MKRIICLFVMSLLLSGCATTAKYETKLNSWIGQSEDALIAGWGVPEKEYRLSDGKKAVEFSRKDIIQTGGRTYFHPQTTFNVGTIGGRAYTGTSVTYGATIEPPYRQKLFCKTSFIINTDGKVESWHHDGNNCVAR